MNSTLGAPSFARNGSGQAGSGPSKVRPMTPLKAVPGLYSFSAIKFLLFKNSHVKKCKSEKVQEYKSSKVQKFKSARVDEFTCSRLQSSTTSSLSPFDSCTRLLPTTRLLPRH